MTVNALIVAAYEAAEIRTRRQKRLQEEEKVSGNKSTTNKPLSDGDIGIYNYVSSQQNPLTWGDFCTLNRTLGFDYPFSSAIWWVSEL